MCRAHRLGHIHRYFAGWGASALAVISAATYAGPLEDLEPGHWVEAPSSNLAPHMPPSTEDDWSGPGAIMGAWSGGAYDTARDRLIIWGGGHHDYAGNEIYVFDVATLAWQRLTDRSADVGGDEGSGYYPDGTPRSRHTYDYIEYLPPPFDRFCSLGGAALFPSGQIGIANVDCFDFETLRWQRMADAPSSGIGALAAVDPTTGYAWIQGTGMSLPLAHFEPMADEWFTHVVEPWGWVGYSYTAAIDPGRQKFVAVGGGETVVWDLAAPDLGPIVLQTTGATEIQDAANPGLAYDLVSEMMVAWMGGADLYTLDLDAGEWLRHPPAPTNTVVPTDAASNGTFGRFRYVASRNVFVVVNAIDENVYFGKLEPGSGTGTGVGGTGGQGGGSSGAGGQGGPGPPMDEPNDTGDEGDCGCRVRSRARDYGAALALMLTSGLWLGRRRRH